MKTRGGGICGRGRGRALTKTHKLTTVITTQVSTEEQTLMVTDADDVQADRMIEAGTEASQFMQTMEIEGKTYTLLQRSEYH